MILIDNPSYTVKMRGLKKMVKVVAFGSSGSGKTTLIRRIDPSIRETGTLKNNHNMTVAFDFGVIDGEHSKVYFYGTPGCERFQFAARTVATGLNIGLLIVDSTRQMTEYEKTILHELKSKSVPFIIVANKVDLPGFSIENIRKDAGFDCMVLPVSAAAGSGLGALVNVIMDIANRLAPKDLSASALIKA